MQNEDLNYKNKAEEVDPNLLIICITIATCRWKLMYMHLRTLGNERCKDCWKIQPLLQYQALSMEWPHTTPKRTQCHWSQLKKVFQRTSGLRWWINKIHLISLSPKFDWTYSEYMEISSLWHLNFLIFLSIGMAFLTFILLTLPTVLENLSTHC